MPNKSSNKNQSHLKCIKSGEISPHLVTLLQSEEKIIAIEHSITLQGEVSLYNWPPVWRV